VRRFFLPESFHRLPFEVTPHGSNTLKRTSRVEEIVRKVGNSDTEGGIQSVSKPVSRATGAATFLRVSFQFYKKKTKKEMKIGSGRVGQKSAQEFC